jgi:phosphoribosylformylglycinamidine cyclo-ligase
MFSLMGRYRDPVLVSGTDGVGTKLLLAQRLGRHDEIGIDLVAMCVNDVVVVGAEPLFFLDYFATGKLAPDEAERVIAGIAAGCREAGCALIGGETAEMPGMYGPGHYDLAGFCVGAVERERRVDPSRIQPGDVLLGLPSSGVHSNGFSLVRRILEASGCDASTPLPGSGQTVLEALLTPTRLYGNLVKELLAAAVPVRGMAHITGGGLPENLPRCLPKGLKARIDPTSWERPALFRWLQENGSIPETDLWNTFNLGVGFCLVVPVEAEEAALATIQASGHAGWLIGSVEGAAEGDLPLMGLPR